MTANTWRPVTPPPPTGPPAMGWMTGSGNISYMISKDPSSASLFFNNSASFCTGASLTTSPVPGHYAAAPVLNLSSYTNSSTATSGGNPDPGLVGDGTTGPNGGLLPKGAITPGVYKYIAYDNENWAPTPTAEKNDPVTYMQDFISACHSHGYKTVCAPGYDIFGTAKTMYPLNPGETQEHWFVRVIVGRGAAGCDLFVLQNESQQNTAGYKPLWDDTVAQMAITGAPGALVFAEVSSENATGATSSALGANMAANAKTLTSPYPDGFYVAMPILTGETSGGLHQDAGRYFFDAMKTAGYTAG